MNELKKEYNAIIKPMFYNKEDWTVEEITKNVWSWFVQKLVEKEPKWISVKENLPDYGYKVIISLNNNLSVFIGTWNKTGWLIFYCDGAAKPRNGIEVTHWQPLPEPPEKTK